MPLNRLAAQLTDTAHAISHALGAQTPARVTQRAASDGADERRGNLTAVA
jgi:hypothetical protein